MRSYISPTTRASNHNRSCPMTPPQLSPRQTGSDSVDSRILIISKRVPQSLLLPMNFDEPVRQSFPLTRFALQPRNEASSEQTPTATMQTQTRRTQTNPVLVTPGCQDLNRRKRQRQDTADSDSDEEELCQINLPKKLLLSLD